MEKIELDEGLRTKLNGLTEQIEICDSTGMRVGVFVPAADYSALMAAAGDALWTPEEEEELARQAGHGRPLADIWKDLGRT